MEKDKQESKEHTWFPHVYLLGFIPVHIKQFPTGFIYNRRTTPYKLSKIVAWQEKEILKFTSSQKRMHLIYINIIMIQSNS